MKCLIAALPLLLLITPAHAEEALPGVQGGHTIVKPEPDEPQPLQADEDGWVTIGNTKVKVGGSVTIDIGAGNLGQTRR